MTPRERPRHGRGGTRPGPLRDQVGDSLVGRREDPGLDLRNVRSYEWPIHEIRIEHCSESSRLKLDCTWNRLNEREEWFFHTVHLLLFEELVVDQP